MLTRRNILAVGGLTLAGCIRPFPARAREAAVIELRGTRDGAEVWFDPIGLLVQAGTRIRWINRENVHTVTAYHPRNDNHRLRIPDLAEPWDSGYLVNPGDMFEVTLTEPGVYDYFCAPHEAAGMVGRIIVETPTGPGSLPFDHATPEFREEVPPAARTAFPSIAEIMEKGEVRRKEIPA